jgi:hypothetical protein
VEAAAGTIGMRRGIRTRRFECATPATSSGWLSRSARTTSIKPRSSPPTSTRLGLTGLEEDHWGQVEEAILLEASLYLRKELF